MKTLSKIVITLIVALLVASPLSAQKMKGKDKMPYMNRLNLSDQQMDKLGELKAANQKKMIDFRYELQKAKLNLKELKRKGNYSRSDYLNAVSEVGKIKEKIETSMAGHRMDVYELLDNDQKEIWNKMDMHRGNKKGMMCRGMMRNREMHRPMNQPLEK